jgi:holo-[acyl-carrier protein] synthase
MILPIAFTLRQKHQSVRPQGLILDSPYVSAFHAESRAINMTNTLPTYDVEDLNGQLCEISISHDGDFATAVALVSCTPGQPTNIGSFVASRP